MKSDDLNISKITSVKRDYRTGSLILTIGYSNDTQRVFTGEDATDALELLKGLMN